VTSRLGTGKSVIFFTEYKPEIPDKGGSATIICVSPLKGQCHEIFCFWYFLLISFPRAPDYAGVVDTGGKFAAGVVDTGGNFATGGGAP
jgi:hypothetical protein